MNDRGMNLESGSIISGSPWPKLVEVKLAEDLGLNIRIVVAIQHTRDHVDRLLPKIKISTHS